MLTAWSGGPLADRLARQSDDEILAEGISAISRGLGMPRGEIERRLQASQVANWLADPWARGAYSYVAVGGGGAPRQLAAPIDNTLFFAGEATESGFGGTVAAAIASGYRAAGEMTKS
jgi:monoamine oxidase